MREWAEYDIHEGDGGESGAGSRIVLSGPMRVDSIGLIERDLRNYDGHLATIDISAVDDIDTVGAWIVSRLADEHDAEIEGANDTAQRLLKAVEVAEGDAKVHPDRAPLVERVLYGAGEYVQDWGKGTIGLLSFLGRIVLAFGSIIRHPRRFPMRAIVRQMELVGVNSLGIIGLMSFLIGVVIAQQGAAQLSQFGAESLTVNLVGRISLRELGVLMAAIMVAGRSGSAFAAQIGTMKLTEEIDAMRTIGISPTEKLIIPRLIACTVMMVFVGFYAAVMSIIGGAAISDLMLDLNFTSFLARVRDVVPTYDLWVLLIKAPVFGLIVALLGCYQGMQVENNAEEVGKRTTQAVVFGIFFVIVVDAIFAVFFTSVGWK
ncbi:ABC transporter inner membrane subunit [Blastomonas marina]|uniref:ABC transporter inner membrane subunit n=1 Tax=Blastomonas marina TaxID=1867408 RepID=A0ABQ1FF32_9SPHN|nr:ABC transporter permease [Blastomonas marina]GGA08870.1 ABC transporter inner membrane subunit [Blastomonas marina]